MQFLKKLNKIFFAIRKHERNKFCKEGFERIIDTRLHKFVTLEAMFELIPHASGKKAMKGLRKLININAPERC